MQRGNAERLRRAGDELEWDPDAAGSGTNLSVKYDVFQRGGGTKGYADCDVDEYRERHGDDYPSVVVIGRFCGNWYKDAVVDRARPVREVSSGVHRLDSRRCVRNA